MAAIRGRSLFASTTSGRRTVVVVVAAMTLFTACGQGQRAKTPEPEKETVSRTEFTERIENFFEFDALAPGAQSSFLIHLTDLSDGSPVEQAQVTMTARPAGGAGSAITTTARVGKVGGIYVAELKVPISGEYEIEFHVKNAKLDERMPLTGFIAK